MREKSFVTAIGSCRISTPFKAASTFYPIINNTARIYGYTHTSAEALQQVRFLQQDFTPPVALTPVLAPNVDLTALDADMHDASDRYFIELSSAKHLRFEGVQVQLNYVTQHFDRFFADRARAASFWRLSDGCQQSAKQAWLENCAEYYTLTPADQALLLGLERVMVTPDMLRADMRALAERLPHLVILTHCNAVGRDGQVIASRARYIDMVEHIAADLKIPVYNPTAAMQAFGQGAALSDAQSSLSHYSEEFGQFLFDGLYQRHIAKTVRPKQRMTASEALATAIRSFENRHPAIGSSPHIGGVAMITGSLGAGGAERQLTRLACALKKRQESVHVADVGITGTVEVIVSTLSADRGRDFFLPELQQAEVPVSVISKMPAGLAASDLSETVEKTLPFLPPNTAEALHRLTPHLMRERPEVAYIWQDGAVLATALAALAAGVPRIVISLRGMPPNLRPEMMKNEYYDMYKALANVPGVEFSANTYAAAAAYTAWLELPSGTIATVHNAAAALPTDGTPNDVAMWEHFDAQTQDADFTFGGVFRFDQNKRALLWLEFAAAAMAAYPRSRFIMVGDGAQKAEALNFVRKMGFSDRCLFTGKTPSVGYWMDKMHLLGLTSRLEGLPNVLIEAQFAGLPVISTPAGGAAEAFIPGQTGYVLSSSEDPCLPEFLKHYLDLANNRQKLHNMGVEARRFARQSFEIEKIVAQTLTLLSDHNHDQFAQHQLAYA